MVNNPQNPSRTGQSSAQNQPRPLSEGIQRGPRRPEQVNTQAKNAQPSPAAGNHAKSVNPQAQGRPIPTTTQTQGKDDKSTFWRVVFWIALVAFIGSVIAIGVIGYSYLKGQQANHELAQIGVGFVEEEEYEFEGQSLADMKVDWDALLAINPETVGWIYIPGTVVNYPIVHTTDDEKYLTTTFKGETGWIASFGAIFLSAANNPDFSDLNNIIYGHHMNDGSMFACITGFRDTEEFNKNRTVYILTPQGNYRLETFSLVICDGYDELAQTKFASPEEFQGYLQDKMDRSTALPDPPSQLPADISKIFTFVTCDYSVVNGRAVLFASVVESTRLDEGVPVYAGEEAPVEGGSGAVDDAVQQAVQ